MQPTDVKTAEDFVRFMEYVWEADYEVYNIWHNAYRSARMLGMKRTGGGKINGEPANVYRFPGQMSGVKIAAHGAAVALNQRMYHHKVKRA